MQTIQLNPSTSALVLIDLQQGIVSRALEPYTAEQVIANCSILSRQFHDRNALVVYVRVDLANFIQLDVDTPSRAPDAPIPPAAASELVRNIGYEPGDLIITKYHWSAFIDTELEQQLAKRHINTIVLGGVSTSIGVESTARQAAGLGINVVFAEDAMSASLAVHHQFSVEHIFPRLGRVTTTQQISLTQPS
jgi:nicotinamidase-related amidase